MLEYRLLRSREYSSMMIVGAEFFFNLRWGGRVEKSALHMSPVRAPLVVHHCEVRQRS